MSSHPSAETHTPAEPTVARPWWTHAIPYPGRWPRMTAYQWRLLGLVGAAELFDHYDQALIGLALLQIQTDLQIAEEDVGTLVGVVRMGMLLAFALTILADRLGRRRLLLITVVGVTVCTFATAFVQTPVQYQIVQFIGRIFMAGESMLAVVVIAEELSAKDRGWGIGLMGALGALGYGLAALLFGAIDVLPYGWRALYALGVLPLLLVAWFRRGLPETRRFEEHKKSREESSSVLDALQPAWLLFRAYPGRLAALGCALLPFAFVGSTAFTFIPKTLQEVHGYTPGEVATLTITAGALGMLGNIVAGQLADRIGRKRVMVGFLVCHALGIAAFYNVSGWPLPALWIVMVFAMTGIGVLFNALGSELFPTSHRSTASGMRSILSTLGSALGLATESLLYGAAGSHAAAITWMVPAMLLSPLLIAWAIPETASRELEHISPER